VTAPVAPVHEGPSAVSKHDFEVARLPPRPASATYTSPWCDTATCRGLSRPLAIVLTRTPLWALAGAAATAQASAAASGTSTRIFALLLGVGRP
jgi:hypothetical protein